MDEMDGFLATVDEFVDDEERIVTYKWLSEQLAVPVIQSREILQRYVDSQKKQNKRIYIVYAIIGRSSCGMCVKVVKDSDLESARSKLDHVISTSIYSVQKMDILNSGMLYSADYDEGRKNLGESAKLGGITYNGAAKLTKDDMKKQKQVPKGAKEAKLALEKQFAKPAADKNKNMQQKMNFFGKTKTSPPKKVPESEPQTKPQRPIKKEADPPAPKKTQKKAGMSAFMTKDKSDPFAKTKTTKKVKEEPQHTENDNEVVSKNGTKSASPSPKKIIEPSSEKLPKNTTEKTASSGKKDPSESSSAKRRFEDDDLKIDDFSDNDDDDFASKENEKFPKKLSEKSNKSEPKRTEKSKKAVKKNSNELPAKKRRRIQTMSSSSEDESDGEDFQEEMDVIPPSPPPPQVSKSDMGNCQNEVHKKKKKVLKTKTFVDDEGCMVTEKSYEFEECDDSKPVPNGNSGKAEGITSEPEPKKKSVSEKSTAAQPKKQTKQASIMGFFKKK